MVAVLGQFEALPYNIHTYPLDTRMGRRRGGEIIFPLPGVELRLLGLPAHSQ
jgi:hypothetical protein